MKTLSSSYPHNEQASVLITTIMTMTILAMICATSLYITSQNITGGMQAASWQQSLTAAESGVDRAIRALNTGDWGNWKRAGTATLPVAEPTATAMATASPIAGPDSTHYLYFPSASSTLAAAASNSPEGSNTTAYWVTVDTAGMTTLQDPNGKQWYRIRSTGKAYLPGSIRSSMSRLDNDLRNTIGLKFDRKLSAATNTLQAYTAGQEGPTRSIEVIMSPIVTGGWARPITAGTGVQMSGGGSVGSFNSNNVPAPYQWTAAYEDHPGNGGIAIVNNTTNSDLRGTSVNGSLQYSGSTVKNTSGVSGTVSTPFNGSLTATVNPTISGFAATDIMTQQYGSAPSLTVFNSVTPNYTAYAGGSPPVAAITVNGNKNNPDYIKITGDFTVPGGKTFTITGAGSNRYAVIWVTGKFTTSGSGQVLQDANSNITWIVDNDITVSGDTYNNASGHAAAVQFIGVGAHKFTDSGSATFTGTLNAPGYDATISGSGDFTGAIIANTVTISGSASVHYDDALGVQNASSVGNYAFASWFEDNSDFTRKDIGGNKLLY